MTPTCLQPSHQWDTLRAFILARTERGAGAFCLADDLAAAAAEFFRASGAEPLSRGVLDHALRHAGYRPDGPYWRGIGLRPDAHEPQPAEARALRPLAAGECVDGGKAPLPAARPQPQPARPSKVTEIRVCGTAVELLSANGQTAALHCHTTARARRMARLLCEFRTGLSLAGGLVVLAGARRGGAK